MPRGIAIRPVQPECDCAMKLRLAALLALVIGLVAGCSKSEPTSSAAAPAQSGPRVVEITAGDTMKFNLAKIEAKPGEELTVILTNIGSQPKEVMGHNWILLKAGTDVEAFDKAAVASRATDYFPTQLASQVIAHTELIGPRKSSETTFKAPTEPGEYVFLCTFPAHYAVGMKGVLVVR